ncbi:hypothetical protein LTR96_010891 [Exophiala xenobiotica]|nr:hypothetical protein LTR92_010913 [Exophiala xenobiotica]KAK5215835.1 hypothetical protein LTR72_011136 [Exophiala xenobiotica]KAK5222349.1 hypothetical protein LTR47_010663 [Exophiala xenobiotica]KAK5246912.1 hypothetical protein LTS06_007831 [Exophiala xenobiotica]KAK5261274.1 hypothetical protein LTR40_002515 [Exophiala xenobiotica]
MSEAKTSPFKTYFDEIAESNGDDECKAWLTRIFELKSEVVDFVSRRRQGGGVGTYSGFLKGSFNFSFRVNFHDGEDVIIRFPKPGHTAFAEEKVANEVAIMEYLRDNTTIPIPRVHSWGLTRESPQQIGPFIIMDFVRGTLLSTILKLPAGEDLLLNPHIDDTILDKVYYQIANYMLQLSQLNFSQIGAISKHHEVNTWSVTARPLTYNMNELATVSGYPITKFPVSPFERTSDYLASLAKEHLTHLWTQRNLVDNPDVARGRFSARHRLWQLIPKYCLDDSGPFIPYCDDMRPSNMLVDPQTFHITAMLDFEFTNAMPAQFTYDPPWWLLLSGPEMWLDQGPLQDFIPLFEHRMEQFLQAMERAENDCESKTMEPSLSVRMRDSWKTGRFWFDYAIRKSFDIDVVYWTALRPYDDDAESLPDEVVAEMESFTQTKMAQLKEYKEDCAMRFQTTNI